jgi:hypothetical protein
MKRFIQANTLVVVMLASVLAYSAVAHSTTGSGLTRDAAIAGANSSNTAGYNAAAGDCDGADCLLVVAVHTGTRCGTTTSVEVDVQNHSDQYLRGYVIFDTPHGKSYSPTNLMKPQQLSKGLIYSCNADSRVHVIWNIGTTDVHYPPHN